MSFAWFVPFVHSLWKALGIPPTKFPIDGITFVSYVLPPLVCHFIVAVLVVMPQTRTVRLALVPLIASLALRAALSVDISGGKMEKGSLNIGFALNLCCLFARTLDWALAKGPLVRHLRPANSPPSTIMDAVDLVVNFRGHGWDWSNHKSFIPRETRPVDPMAFVFCTSLSAVVHALICAPLHRAVVTLAPVGVGPFLNGSTIFDESLPFLVRYLRASIISTFTALTIYTSLQVAYDLCTILAILALGQNPVQWPPLFDAPWSSTSLSDFWGRRWHQLLRHTLITGSHPLSFVLGRSGNVIGAFLVSAILHHAWVIAIDDRIEIWWMLVGFGMMAPGILAERAFYKLTGKRVGGVLGWLWTMTWLLLWGNVIIEGFTRAGMFRFADFADNILPVWTWVEHLMVNFDAWLHTI